MKYIVFIYMTYMYTYLFSMEFGPSFGEFATLNLKIYDKHKMGPGSTDKNEVTTPINGITNR